MEASHLNRLVANAQTAVQEAMRDNDDTEDFQTTENQQRDVNLMEQTRQLFRRRRSASPDLPNSRTNRARKRGRKRDTFWKAKLFLFRRSNPDFLPSPAEVKHLTANGYGVPSSEVLINRNWGRTQLENYIQQLYPNAPLGLVGLDFAQCSKARKINRTNVDTTRELEGAIGKGKLVIIPRRDLPEVPGVVPESGTPTVSFNIPSSSQARQDIYTLSSSGSSAAGGDAGPSGGNLTTRAAPSAPARAPSPSQTLSGGSATGGDAGPSRGNQTTRAAPTALENAPSPSQTRSGSPTAGVDAGPSGENLTARAAPTVAANAPSPSQTLLGSSAAGRDAGPSGGTLTTHAAPTALANTPSPSQTVSGSIDELPTFDLGDVTEVLRDNQMDLDVRGGSTDELPIFDLGDVTEVLQDNQMDLDVKGAILQLQTSLTGDMEVKVKRENVVDKILTLHSDPDACRTKMSVTFEGESGQDLGGLTKEAMTLFWNEVTRDLFTGEHVTVPCLPLHRERKEKWKFRALGRALSHTVALTGALPCRLPISGLIAMIFDCEVNSEILLHDFMMYISTAEKALIYKAVTSFSSLSSSEQERLTTFFSVNGMMDIPKESEIRDQVIALAGYLLVTVPKRHYSLMKEGIPEDHITIFWNNLSIDHLRYILESQRPTPAKVAATLKTTDENLRGTEERILYFLTEFVRGMDMDDLMNFLMFTTGSVHMPPDGISVSFVNTSGILRRPVAHTCSCLLELSTCYASSQEFKREMRMYLSSEYSYQYTLL